MKSKTKTDPFAGLGATPIEPVEAVPEVLERRPSNAQRNREWEHAQRRNGDVATYRGVPKALQEELRRVAEKRHVPVGEVVRAFLEYALVAYEKDALTLTPQFGAGKLTLYPAG